MGMWMGRVKRLAGGGEKEGEKKKGGDGCEGVRGRGGSQVGQKAIVNIFQRKKI